MMTRTTATLLLAALAALAVLADPARAEEPVEVGPVTLRFPGARALSWSSLAARVESEIVSFARSRFDAIYAEDAADRLWRHYLAEGYPRAEVVYDEEASRPLHGELAFRVREGPRLLIGEVSFAGNVGVDTATLARFVRRRAGLLAAPILVENRLRSDLRSMELYYAERGWLRARAEMSWSVPEDAEGELEIPIAIRIAEGPRTMIAAGDVVLEGLDPERTAALDELVAGILEAESPGGSSPYHRMLPYRFRGAIRDHFGARGYPFCTVADRYEALEGETRARLTLAVDPGRPATVAAVDIVGNLRVPDFVIRREITLDRNESVERGGTIDIGAPYDARRVRSTQLALLRLGLFTSVRIDSVPMPDDPDRVLLRIRVREKETRTLDLRAGFGTYDLWRLGLSYRNRAWSGPGDALGLNWFGHGLRLKLETEASARGFAATGQIREPRAFSTRVEAVLDGTIEQRQNVSFSFRRAGFTLGLGRALREVDPRLRAEAAWTFRITDTYRVVGELDEEFEDVVNLSSLALGLTGDWRDSGLWPTNGVRFALRGELADRRLGGDLDFFRAVAEVSGHRALDDEGEFVLSLGARAGVIVPRGDTAEIPLSERFLSGGADTVRSFEEQQLGPRTDGEPEGGEARLLANAEFRFPVYRPVYAALFADAGNLLREAEDFGLDDIETGLGAGLRIRTPVGPLSLDAAWNPDPGDGDPTWVFHFSVGFAF